MPPLRHKSLEQHWYGPYINREINYVNMGVPFVGGTRLWVFTGKPQGISPIALYQQNVAKWHLGKCNQRLETAVCPALAL